MAPESVTAWKRWAAQIGLTIVITVAANAIVIGKYIDKIDNTAKEVEKLSGMDIRVHAMEKKVETLEATDKELGNKLVDSQVDRAMIRTQLANIAKNIEELKQTQTALMQLLSKKLKN